MLLLGGCLRGCANGPSGSGNFSKPDPDADSLSEFFGSGSGELGRLWSERGLGEVATAALVAAFLVVMALVLLFRAWILPGWVRLHAEILHTGEGRFETLFDTMDVFGASLSWAAVQLLIWVAWIAAIGGPFFLLLVVPPEHHLAVGAFASAWGFAMCVAGIYLFLKTAFVNHAIALERLDVMAAIGRSFDLSAGNLGWLVLYMFCYGVVGVVMAMAGMCFCFVGTFVTQPLGIVIRDFGFTEGFLRITRPAAEVASWSVHAWGDG